MNWCLLYLCLSSIFVKAAKRKLDSESVSEEPSQKIQRLSNDDAVSVQGSGLVILADLIPLFLHFSDHRLAPSLSQVNRACFKAVCNSSFKTTNEMPCLLATPKSWGLVVPPAKIIFNFAFQHLMNTNDTIPRRVKMNSLFKILTGLDRKPICIAVSEMLKAMVLDKNEMNNFCQRLTIIHRNQEVNGNPTPYLTIFPKILMGGYESFSEEINSEIVRMLRYGDHPEVPERDKITEIYHKFFQDMFLMFPEYCTQKYQELHDTEEICFLEGFDSDYTGMFGHIMGPYAGIVAQTLAPESVWTRLKADNYDYLWKIILNKLNFLPRRNLVEIDAQFNHPDPETFAEFDRLFKLVGALVTFDAAFSLEGLSDTKISRLMKYVSHCLQVDPTPEYIRSVAEKVVNAKDVVTPFHLKTVLYHTSNGHYIYELMEEKIAALPAEECLFEHLKFIEPTVIFNFTKYRNNYNLAHSFVPHLQSNLCRIALGDKVMANKYDEVLSFMVNSFPKTSLLLASLLVSAALADKFLSEEKNLFFVFDKIPGMAATLRKSYYAISEASSSHAISHVYPVFRSFRVVASGTKADMKPWLTYWTVLGLLHCGEYITDTFIFWLPFYNEAKVLLRLWLVIPEAQGSLIIYESYVRPMLSRHEQSMIRASERIKRDASELLRAGVQLGLGRFFELFTQYQESIVEFISKHGMTPEPYSDFEDIQPSVATSGVKIELVEDDVSDGGGSIRSRPKRK